jgi:hypothetical protein
MSDIRSDVLEEALRIANEAKRRGLSLRLLGGVAIRLRAQDELLPVFEREYNDSDWITPKGTSADVQQLFEALGYSPHVRFNAIYGRERLLFFDKQHDRQVDVFVGVFRMSHKVPFGKRLDMEPMTIPLAELLLTKLQIAELNEKDVRDALGLLHDHPVGDEDGDSINGRRIAVLCTADWGLWRTFTANLRATGEHMEHYDLPEESKRRIGGRILELQERIEQEPKSLAWKIRSKIGERKRWYELPEEVAGGP